MSLSTLGLVAVGRTYSGGLLAVMSTWFSVLYEVGATVGPVIAGMAMVRLGADGLPLTLALACGHRLHPVPDRRRPDADESRPPTAPALHPAPDAGQRRVTEWSWHRSRRRRSS